MAPRSFWKGYLRLSLVTCRVAMVPATSPRGKVRFHTINRATGNRVESRYVDEETGKPVRESDEVKGYPVSEDRFILLEDDELEAVALESARTIDIDTFVARDEIPWIWLDKAHYLTPDDKIAEEAFSVIRDAMAATGRVGISRVVLYRRERALMLEPRGKGIVVWTLRYGDEVREAEDYFSGIDEGKPDTKALRMIGKLIDERTAEWDPSMVQDPVQKRLKRIISSKKKKQKPPAPRKGGKKEAPAETPDNVVSIMDALRKSVEAEKKGGKSR
ncbi:MAG: non-homologous end joining protein Ku [Neoaquamicrobium sediminum]|uniref:non-homologous end joining protein Ku n=1 Tax=Neoaquamicrobium sediminum TaxID=1849104 RepID=UPI0040357EA2